MSKQAKSPVAMHVQKWAKYHRISISVFIGVVLYGLLIPVFFDAGNPSFSKALKPPSSTNFFGTDHFGFDLFVRTAESLRVSLVIGSLSALVATALGVIVGLIAAAVGGRTDRIIMRLNDAVNSIPHLILSVVIVALFRGSLVAIVLSIALTHWSPVARIVRSSVLAVRTSDYVDASYAAGGPFKWVLIKHLAPAAAGQAVVAMIMLMPHAVWHESALSFLGLGIQADEPSLGTLMDLAREDIMRGAWWALVFPAAVLLATTLSAVSLARKVPEVVTDLDVTEAEEQIETDVVAPSTGMEVHNVSVVVHGKDASQQRILKDASLHVEPGSIHGLIGASGSGKTTLGKSIVGIAPQYSKLIGRVSVAGKPLAWGEKDFSKIRGTVVGFVPQSAAQSFTPVRRLGTQLQEIIDRHQGKNTVPELLRTVHLPEETAEFFPHQLSGGMAQRAAIAAALAGNPTYLIADEPTSALDPQLTSDILALFKEIADSQGVGILVISHDIEDLRESEICDTVSVMRNGEIMETGPARKVLNTPDHAYTRALLAALPSGGLKVTEGLERG
ncbi:peptide ABC transporter permease [Corynebacterium ulcerans]|uniref:ATP-binding cassette domain-containing protein n=1 Tax=Corynebacterium ulcerans TaxID=65058 RepID=UPI0002185236|nr:ATP-binding cassette domain-containing protein [Corynebacterium ulcerans]AEG82511.1 putative membrane protein [Corynebacterium ulcerans 809]AIU31370.1 Oligopeptide transport system permease protein [Corynebacterium ulcerans]AIU92641.1 Oligopeptide transport system permease protein oppC [Corynebacterium ulcerans]MBH5296331.1 dipeptide/oligopeptide/nickel ABC transporter permease/ATP-binding protein [Corynebacterium ulcerans]MBH5302323.1 dipeptide/oligopeptide/nickel ABC transporter permease/